MVRPRIRLSPSPIGSAQRYLVRLVTLSAICLAAIVLFSTSSRQRPNDPTADNPEFIQTALAPSPFAQLGAGVFISEPAPAGPEQPAEPAAPEEPEAPAVGPDGLPQVNKQLLRRILDKTTAIPAAAYYHLVKLANSTPAEVLQKHAATEQQVTFAHLRRDPDQYRGELIYLKGYLRTLKQFEASENKMLNPMGLTHLYQGDLFTDASRPNPYIIIVPEVPAGLPLGNNLTENVTFVGYFLKQWRYKTAADVDRAAPLLIGRIVTWTPTPAVEVGHPKEHFYIALVVGFIIAGFVALSWLVVWFYISRRRALGLSSEGAVEPESVRADLARLEDGEPLPEDPPPEDEAG